ncbi:zinc ribbon domain-containing protein [Candidatus Borrarchaeum sp.]|uniref:zinc ribbon domain-containing protein n=1 Tax=Candidatus Borrarchaeum sp. TaxID=2846742 RepID=UPI00257F6B6A|nr:zinc ribbon domain-containing protein [Candidatus Borrarchaeum sp.]
MGYIGFLGSAIYDSKGKPFGTIERFVQFIGTVILEVKLSEEINGLDQIQIPLVECIIKNDSISTKKSIKSILNAEKKKKKDELKEEQERFKKMLEKRRMLSEPESVAPVNNDSLVSEVPSVLKEKEGPSTPADWIICPNCDSALKELYRFCPYCSEPLPYCPNCGKPVKEDFKACPHCGSRL